MTETLPALRSLGKLADCQPVIVVDSREQTPLTFTRFPTVSATLPTGDYSISGLEHLFSIERKTVDDLANCCLGANRERFERELHRLRGFRFKRLLVVGSVQDIEGHRYHSNAKPASILGSVRAWEVRYDIPVVWAELAMAPVLVEDWVWYFSREIVKDANELARALTTRKGLTGNSPVME